jgi:hypothetical protein
MNEPATDNEDLESGTPPAVLAYYKRCVELIVFQSNGRDVSRPSSKSRRPQKILNWTRTRLGTL